jgi:histone H2A
MRNGRYCKRTGIDAPIMLAACLEFLCAEVLEISGEVCKELGRRRITPRHVEIAVRRDADFERFF